MFTTRCTTFCHYPPYFRFIPKTCQVHVKWRQALSGGNAKTFADVEQHASIFKQQCSVREDYLKEQQLQLPTNKVIGDVQNQRTFISDASAWLLIYVFLACKALNFFNIFRHSYHRKKLDVTTTA